MREQPRRTPTVAGLVEDDQGAGGAEVDEIAGSGAIDVGEAQAIKGAIVDEVTTYRGDGQCFI